MRLIENEMIPMIITMIIIVTYFLIVVLTISSNEGSGLWPISSIIRCNGNCPENVGTFIPNILIIIIVMWYEY